MGQNSAIISNIYNRIAILRSCIDLPVSGLSVGANIIAIVSGLYNPIRNKGTITPETHNTPPPLQHAASYHGRQLADFSQVAVGCEFHHSRRLQQAEGRIRRKIFFNIEGSVFLFNFNKIFFLFQSYCDS